MRTQASYIKKKRSKNPRDGWTSRQSSAVNKRQGKSLLVLLTGLEIVKCVTKCVFPRKPSFERSWRFQVSSENSRVCVALPFHCCCSITKSCPALFVTPWIAPCQAPLSSTVSWSLLKFMFVESVMLSNHLILCHSILLLPSILLSFRVFFSFSHQVTKVLELQL